MKKETDGNQAATQSSGNNRGSAAQKTNSHSSSISPLSVEQLKGLVLGADGDICDQFYNPRGYGQCSTCGHLGTAHEPARRQRQAVDALIAAVRADEREKERQK